MTEEIPENIVLPHSCPHCQAPEKFVHTREELDRLFGTRVINGILRIPQSWCRDCRKEGLKNAGFDPSIAG